MRHYLQAIRRVSTVLFHSGVYLTFDVSRRAVLRGRSFLPPGIEQALRAAVRCHTWTQSPTAMALRPVVRFPSDK
jgi:hypothetical protein